MSLRTLSTTYAIRSATFAALTIAIATAASPLWAQQNAVGQATVPVTVANFKRAESDLYFGNIVKLGGFGKLYHYRTPTPIEDQQVVAMNRDTLYSGGVFDLDASPVTITLPDTGKRFMSLLVITEDHYAPPVVYAPGTYTIDKAMTGTRYVMLAIRTFVNANDPADIKAANALQDKMEIKQASIGEFKVPNWDPVSQGAIRDHAVYNAVYPTANDGNTVYKLTVKDVPVDGFWSISVYNAKRYFEKNPLDSYSVNNVTAKPNPDGSYTIQFGGCAKETPNCLFTPAGWNYNVRQYRPRKEIIEGSWVFPKAEPVK